jgi:hypothetical protein
VVTDDTTKYDQKECIDLLERYGMQTLTDLDKICTCGNRETMQIGQVIILLRQDLTGVCCGYEELDKILNS